MSLPFPFTIPFHITYNYQSIIRTSKTIINKEINSSRYSDHTFLPSHPLTLNYKAAKPGPRTNELLRDLLLHVSLSSFRKILPSSPATPWMRSTRSQDQDSRSFSFSSSSSRTASWPKYAAQWRGVKPLTSRLVTRSEAERKNIEVVWIRKIQTH